jgi:dGTPase
MAALKDLTSDLIGLFCTQVRRATIDKHGDRPLVRHTADLVVPRETEVAVAALKGVAAHYVMRADGRVAVLERQRAVIAELVSLLTLRGPATLMPAFRADYEAAGDDAERLRVVVDQVASLTDASALAWHDRLR